MNGREQPSFPFGGRLSLDLTWTVRYRAVLPTELLVEPDHLRQWLEAVDLPAPATPTKRDLSRVKELREAIYRAAEATLDARSIAAADLGIINRFAAHAPPAPVLGPHGRRTVVAPIGRAVAASLSAVARDAIDLLAGGNDGRLRRCAGPQCSLLFHDASRPGARRWCDTARCGNRANTKAYRRRLTSDAPSP